jgi:predicted metal-binding transcription factor (methanogenesis marker protein 9)
MLPKNEQTDERKLCMDEIIAASQKLAMQEVGDAEEEQEELEVVVEEAVDVDVVDQEGL